MKTLKDFILESNKESKTFVFNFNDLEDNDEILKSIEQYDFVDIDDKKASVTLSDNNKNDVDEFLNTIQQFCYKIRTSTSRTNNEQYAQKTVKFENTLKKFKEYLDNLLNPEDEKTKEEEE